jgi:ATP-dependent DNA helicase RecG
MALEQSPSVRIPFNQEKTISFVQRLPFTLTPGQKRSAWDILQDMDKPHPMNRLVEGDVGSGKTVVAAIAILNVAAAGCQTAYLAPTEVLARQHFENITKLLKPFGTRVGLFTQASRRLSTMDKAITKPVILHALEAGEVDLIIGTHALITGKVKFAKLALVVVDEQHRFGVEQRKVLRSAGTNSIPHFLSLTATPIPRTLALTVWGDLSVSQIPHLPSERKPIITRVLDDRNRDTAYHMILERCKAGEQAFVICPRIETDRRI